MQESSNTLVRMRRVLGVTFVVLAVGISAFATDNATFSFAVDSNAWYNLQASTNLSTWTVLQTVHSSTDGVFNLVDVESSNYPYRFYRRTDAPVPPPSFGKSFGGNSSDLARSAVVDAQGDIFLTGQFQGNVDFGGGITSSLGANDMFLLKYDSDGVFQKSHRIGLLGSEHPMSGALGPNGEWVVAGNFTGRTDLRENSLNPNSCAEGAVAYPGNFNASGTDIFLARYDTSCTCFWARQFGGLGTDGANGVAVDSQGYIYMTGSFQQSVDFNLNGSKSYSLTTSNTAAFLAKYDPIGNFQWVLGFDAVTNAVGSAICLNRSGDATIACNFTVSTNKIFVITPTLTNSIALPPGLTNCIGSSSFFIASFLPGASNSPGTIFPVRFATFPAGVTNNGYAYARSITADADGNIYVSGSMARGWPGVFSAGLILGGNEYAFNDATGTTNVLTSTNWSDSFIAKYSEGGICKWVKLLKGSATGAVEIDASCVDSNNFLTVAGEFIDTLNVDGIVTNVEVTGSGDNLFISQFSPSGLYQKTLIYGNSGYSGCYPLSIAPNNANGLVVAGEFMGTNMTLGPFTTNSVNNSSDGFVFQIDP